MFDMTNEEAVKCLNSDYGKYDCNDCRFYTIDESSPYKKCTNAEVYKIAIEAIKKQIPMKPDGKYTTCKCPVCGRRVRSGLGSSSYGRRDNFCQKCGQKLDWEGIE